MKRNVSLSLTIGLLIVLFGCVSSLVHGQPFDPNYTSPFSAESYHFSPFGRATHTLLHPGLEKLFVRESNPVRWSLRIRHLNQLESIAIPNLNSTRTISARVVEEQLLDRGEVIETRRYFLGRSLENGHVFCFGKEIVATSEDISPENETGSWRIGNNESGMGLFMPGLLLQGSRFYREPSPGFSMIKAEIFAESEPLSTPLRQYSETAIILVNDDSSPGSDGQKEWYSTDVGLVARDEFKLSELRYGTEGLPVAARFTPFSQHSYFPLSAGMRWAYEGMEDFQTIRFTAEVLKETKIIKYRQGEEAFVLPAAVVESREWVGGNLHEVNRIFYTQCIETQDVFYLGEEVDILLEGGDVVIHDGTWLAGVDGAEPGVIMPGDFILSARYLQESVPDVSMNEALNDRRGIQVDTPAGFFQDCIQIEESSLVFPEEPPSLKIYAPGVGLVDDDATLQLTEFYSPHLDSIAARIEVQPALLLQWPLEDQPFRLESSQDLKTWHEVDMPMTQDDFRFQMSVPSSLSEEYFRLIRE